MKIKLYESKWDNKIKGELAKSFYDNIKDADLDGVKEASIKILEKCREFFDPEEEYIANDIDVLVDEFDDAHNEEELDALLDALYDFCDDYLILIDVSEEPADAEIFIDSEKDTGTKEEPEELEPVEVEEIPADEESK